MKKNIYFIILLFIFVSFNIGFAYENSIRDSYGRLMPQYAGIDEHIQAKEDALKKYFKDNNEIVKKKDNILYSITYEKGYNFSCKVITSNFNTSEKKRINLNSSECLALLTDLYKPSILSHIISIILLALLAAMLVILKNKIKPLFAKLKKQS